jgi:uncharacterized protein YdbL (DUF1318 family)
MKKILIAVFSLMMAFPAYALDLAAARSQQMVGEGSSGYIVPLAKSKEVVELATDINAKRKMEYMRISKENGQPVDVVAKLAAQQIIQGLPKGAQYQGADGSWKTK